MGQADMDDVTCGAPEGCDRTDIEGSDRLCHMHYMRKYRHGATAPRPRARATCVICGQPAVGRGWCRMHYQRWRTTGDPLTEPRNGTRDHWEKVAREELETGLRKCKTCKEIKPLDCYAEESRGRNGRAHACQPCVAATSKAAHDRRKQRDPEGARRKSRNTHLRSEYGLTVDEFDAMAARQHGRCAACGKKTKLVLDHDHDTGHVRGLLCNPCNLSLGFAEDSIKRLEQLRAYLLAHKGRIF